MLPNSKNVLYNNDIITLQNYTPSKVHNMNYRSGAFDEAGIDPLINNMVSTMIDNKRSTNISGVVGAYNTIMAAQRGEVKILGFF